ncbi:hypothetical protein RIF29_36354 [Crotalaria pallida]|uniref:Uncharacterized protein n=1 Tax=Crotalaria pallida TaxID=3830 RepID=A0AAN9HVP9_CROPI
MIGGDLIVAGCSAVVANGGLVGTGETREGDGGGSVFLDDGAAFDEGEREDDNVSVVVGGVGLFAEDGTNGGIDVYCLIYEGGNGGYKIVIVVTEVVGKGKGSVMDGRSQCVGKVIEIVRVNNMAEIDNKFVVVGCRVILVVGNGEDEFVVEKRHGDLLFSYESLPL